MSSANMCVRFMQDNKIVMKFKLNCILRVKKNNTNNLILKRNFQKYLKKKQKKTCPGYLSYRKFQIKI